MENCLDGKYDVVHAGYPTPCWIWSRGKTNGYGEIKVKGKTLYAHRAMFEKYFGPVPAGTEIDHLCRNRSCVNPFHLDPVSHKDNLRRGPRVKLTYDQVKEIRDCLPEERRALASKFGVCFKHIGAIRRGTYWK